MKCKIADCGRDAMYTEQQVCQKHYFRFMRNGHYDLKERDARNPYSKTRMYRTQNPAGYQKLYEPHHPLAEKGGDVYEHRFVYYNEINAEPYMCDLCEDSINWSNCHIDHIDEDVSNNKPENLRALCRPCNTFRGHSSESMGKHIFDIDGKRMSPFAWARQEGVEVAGATILRRRLVLKMNDYDCVYSKRITHHNTATKTGKGKKKYDDVRGI